MLARQEDRSPERLEELDTSAAEVQASQLLRAASLFDSLAPRVAALGKLAAEQGIGRIKCIEDIAPLLFPHTLFKSYPLAWLERGSFTQLTRWLAGLTSLDLSHVDCDGIETVDAWIDHLDRITDLRVVHTFGTSGKLSFVPRTRSEWQLGGQLIGECLRDWRGPGLGVDLFGRPRPIVQPFFRHGASAATRGVATLAQLFAGGEENVLYLYPNARFSADVASFAGRLRAAHVRGEQGLLELSPQLLARRGDLARQESERPRHLAEFFQQVEQRFSGQDIYLFGVWPVIFDWAEAGRKRGLRNVFGSGSILHTGGGTKGRQFPPGWRSTVSEFLGFETCYEFYAMTELIPACPRCEEGHYHIPSAVIPFVLDPRSGNLLPRTGRHTGRFAFLDLEARSYWAGVVTGDEVTLHAPDSRCRCGRAGFHIEAEIRRYDQSENGDDKISCAGAPDAHDQAIEHLLRTSVAGERAQ
jgi:hypothetical protein